MIIEVISIVQGVYRAILITSMKSKQIIFVTVQSQALSINAPAPSLGTGVIQ